MAGDDGGMSPARMRPLGGNALPNGWVNASGDPGVVMRPVHIAPDARTTLAHERPP